ncbi:TRAP transporter substrate-binding protein DctP [Alsobacter sp. SYSU M60028]|uniref:TRAP transporter substrate-binding protein DctP n=1 Tax=Alsobacter ponti TaxID=2962936 RepID=A0ABT1LFU6_9HYPH|nr:TRAP transporter substrate-binding protein DctP [Alsobacter ponti]MCP8939988.1 TRAP transporter substrate-binding protein DctP [Alsobacter ponti]
MTRSKGGMATVTKALCSWKSIVLAGLAAFAAGPVPASAETTIKFATTMPSNSVIYKSVYAPWVDALNAAGKGEFVVVPFEPPFATGTNVWDRVVSGVADMGFAILANTGLPFPKSSVSMLPGLGHDTEVGSIALWRLFEKGLISDEFRSVKVINVTTLPPVVLVTKKSIQKLEDVAGLKIRAVDKISADSLTALGASPVAIPFTEAYQAISKGVVQGFVANGGTLVAYKFGEVMDNQIANAYFGMLPSAIFMNAEFYDRLSPKAKEIFARFIGEESSRMIGAAYIGFEAQNFEAVRGQNAKYTMRQLPPEELARWKDATKPVVDAWKKDTPGGADIYSRFVEEYARAEKK